MPNDATLCLLTDSYTTVAQAHLRLTKLPYWALVPFNAEGQKAYGKEGVALLYRVDPYQRSPVMDHIAARTVTDSLGLVAAARGIEPYSSLDASMRQESLILLIAVDGRVFAYCTGQGSQAMPFDMIVGDFGLTAVLKTVPHNQLVKLGIASPGTRGFARSEKLNQPGGAHRFVLSSYYSSLRRVMGEVKKNNRSLRLEAADGVRVEFPFDKNEAVSTAQQWFSRFRKKKSLPEELVDLCSIRRIESEAERETLLRDLHAKILAGVPLDLAVVPWLNEVEDDGRYAYHCKPDRSKPKYDVYAIHTSDPKTWGEAIRLNLPDFDTFAGARATQDGQNATDGRRLSEWLSYCGTSPTGTDIVFDGGRWYELQGDFLTRLEKDCDRIINRFRFPHPAYTYAFKSGDKEYEFNKDFCDTHKYTLLDEGVYRKFVGKSPVELCDAFDIKGKLYVVKRLHSMDSIVKAVSQAIDAAEAIRSDKTYWSGIMSKAKLTPRFHAKDDPDKWRFVVLLVGSDGKPLLDQLTFKGRLELRRFREQIGAYKHDYGVAFVKTT